MQAQHVMAGGRAAQGSMSVEQLRKQRDELNALIAEKEAAPRVASAGSLDMARSMSQLKRTPTAVPTSISMQQSMSSSFARRSISGPSVVVTSFPSRWTPSATQPHLSLSPEDYIGGFNEPYSFAMQRSRSSMTHGSYPVKTSVSFEEGSYASSTHLTTPSLYSGAGSSFSDNTSFMSRNPSTCSAHYPDLSMLRMNSSASQAYSTAGSEVMFPFEEETLSKAPVPLFDDLGHSNDVTERMTAQLVHLGAGMSWIHQSQTPPYYRDENQHTDLLHISEETPGASVEMKRTGSNESAVSTSSTNSSTSTTSQASQRYQKHLDNANRSKLRPKIEVTVATSSAASVVGSTKSASLVKKAISKAPTKRAKPSQRLKCKYCNKHADGFHGHHELKRHVDRAHRAERKAWICVDMSKSAGGTKPKRPLNICKHCCHGKQYNVYYNAAAHIRRSHFNPRSKTSRGQSDASSKRAGNSGGNEPTIQWLMEKGWIKEIDVLDANAETGTNKNTRLNPLSSIRMGKQPTMKYDSMDVECRPLTEVPLFGRQQEDSLAGPWEWTAAEFNFNDMSSGMRMLNEVDDDYDLRDNDELFNNQQPGDYNDFM